MSDYEQGYKDGIATERERCAQIAEQMAANHANCQGTVVAGSYSEEAIAAVHVNVMAKANDIAKQIREP